MRQILCITWLVALCAALFCAFSLWLSFAIDNPEWFQASGAVVTIAGVILAARRLIRLGPEEVFRRTHIIDHGRITAAPGESPENQQIKQDIHAYRVSIILLLIGTIIWAYGGIVLRAMGVDN